MRFPLSTIPFRAFACLAVLLCTFPALSEIPAEAVGYAGSAAEAWPAARRHVRVLEGQPCMFTSRLARVVELNFTFANGHQPGKAIIAATLDRIAKAYGEGGNDAFAVRHIKQGTDGASGLQPAFTLDDLLSGEVIVANNIGRFNSPEMPATKQEAIRTAIEMEGRGFFAFHGSGEAELRSDGWAWLTDQLIPSGFQGHTNRASFPVYKHLEESRHIVSEGILDSNVTPAEVPDEINASGQARFASGVPTRSVRVEPYRFARDIFRDPAYSDRATLLLKYDARTITDLLPHFKRNGGNMLAYLLRVGAGMTSYFQLGHENDELLAPTTGFDGGVGDFDRYVAQTLFFLAGYDTTACDASCNGLPAVDADNRLTGEVYAHTSQAIRESIARDLRFDPATPAFSQPHDVAYEAMLVDLSGQVVASRRGKGPIRHEFDHSSLKPGVYFLSVKLGKAPARIKRYALASSAP